MVFYSRIRRTILVPACFSGKGSTPLSHHLWNRKGKIISESLSSHMCEYFFRQNRSWRKLLLCEAATFRKLRSIKLVHFVLRHPTKKQVKPFFSWSRQTQQTFLATYIFMGGGVEEKNLLETRAASLWHFQRMHKKFFLDSDAPMAHPVATWFYSDVMKSWSNLAGETVCRQTKTRLRAN